MADTKLKLGRTGWKRLDLIIAKIEGEINARTPIAGLGIDVDQHNDGRQIHTHILTAGDKEATVGQNTGGGGGGTVANVAGAKDGVPVTFHLSQTSAATPL